MTFGFSYTSTSAERVLRRGSGRGSPLRKKRTPIRHINGNASTRLNTLIWETKGNFGGKVVNFCTRSDSLLSSMES